MSLQARDWAWAQPVSPSQKLVLLVLAEHANEERACWPSLRCIAGRTGLSERCIRGVLRELERLGLITCQCGGGRMANRFTLQVGPRQQLPEGQEIPGGQMVPEGQQLPPTPEPAAPQGGSTCPSEGQHVPPNRNRTEIEPSLNRKRARTRARAVAPPSWIDRETWQAYLEHRRCIRAPMSQIAQQRAITALERLRDDGQDPEAVLNQSIVNGWKGLFPVKAGNPGAPSTFDSNVRVLYELFGDQADGQEDLPAGAGVSGHGLRNEAVPRAHGGVLGPTRRVSR